MFLDYCLRNVQFWGKNEHHIWKDQSLFFYLHITCYCKYSIGLQLLANNKALHKCYAEILHYSFSHLHPA
jgi:hypothetical protein